MYLLEYRTISATCVLSRKHHKEITEFVDTLKSPNITSHRIIKT